METGLVASACTPPSNARSFHKRALYTAHFLYLYLSPNKSLFPEPDFTDLGLCRDRRCTWGLGRWRDLLKVKWLVGDTPVIPDSWGDCGLQLLNMALWAELNFTVFQMKPGYLWYWINVPERCLSNSVMFMYLCVSFIITCTVVVKMTAPGLWVQPWRLMDPNKVSSGWQTWLNYSWLTRIH